MAMIELKGITKTFDNKKKLYDNFSCSFEDGKTAVILGESGSGKTTLLNIMAGLTDYDGEVKGVLKPLSMVFQKDCLIKNLTVEENLKLVNKNADIKKELKEIGLEGREKDYIKTLSGGMARRVAILRALLYNSKQILMDEPFINLDYKLKYGLMDRIKGIVKQGRTVIMVTHDVLEAVYIADRIIVIKKGNIIADVKEIKNGTEKELIATLTK